MVHPRVAQSERPQEASPYKIMIPYRLRVKMSDDAFDALMKQIMATVSRDTNLHCFWSYDLLADYWELCAATERPDQQPHEGLPQGNSGRQSS